MAKTTNGQNKTHQQKENKTGLAQSRSTGGGMRSLRSPATPTPFSGFRRFREEMDQLFDRFLGGANLPMKGHERNWDFDVQQEDGTVKVRADAPGFEPEDFDIQVSGDHLILCACHESAKAEEGAGEQTWSRREFHRTIPLPTGVDVEHIDASYRQGVLTVEMPISEEHRPKHITVKG